MLDPDFFPQLSEQMLKFAADQMSVWPLANANFRALKSAARKKLCVGGLEVEVLNIPSRSISTNAATDAASLAKRPCFLCAVNRPRQQRVQEFEGAKNKRYNIQVNPYPIVPDHFVIPSVEHTPQSIWHRYVDMLRLAKRRPGFTIIYNGPKSGASAPDHFHFQAVPSELLPLEKAVRTKKNQRYVTCVSDARLYEYQGYADGVFVIWGKSSKSMNRMFYRLLDCADVPQGDTEPRFNLYSFRQDGEYCSVVVFRTSHRSRHYSSADPSRHLAMSPGCIDMGGCFVTVDKTDFNKLDSSLLQELLAEVTIGRKDAERIIHRLTRTQTLMEVELYRGGEIAFEVLTDGAGIRRAVCRDGRIEYGGILYDELYFEARNPSTMFAQPSFAIGSCKYAGALRITCPDAGELRVVNVIGSVDYKRALLSFADPQGRYMGLPEQNIAAIDSMLDREWDN